MLLGNRNYRRYIKTLSVDLDQLAADDTVDFRTGTLHHVCMWAIHRLSHFDSRHVQGQNKTDVHKAKKPNVGVL